LFCCTWGNASRKKGQLGAVEAELGKATHSLADDIDDPLEQGLVLGLVLGAGENLDLNLGIVASARGRGEDRLEELGCGRAKSGRESERRVREVVTRAERASANSRQARIHRSCRGKKERRTLGARYDKVDLLLSQEHQRRRELVSEEVGLYSAAERAKREKSARALSA